MVLVLFAYRLLVHVWKGVHLYCVFASTCAHVGPEPEWLHRIVSLSSISTETDVQVGAGVVNLVANKCWTEAALQWTLQGSWLHRSWWSLVRELKIIAHSEPSPTGRGVWGYFWIGTNKSPVSTLFFSFTDRSSAVMWAVADSHKQDKDARVRSMQQRWWLATNIKSILSWIRTPLWNKLDDSCFHCILQLI